MSSLNQGINTIDTAEKELGSPVQIPALGSDPVCGSLIMNGFLPPLTIDS